MHADRGVEIRIGRCHDRGGRPTGGEPGDIDPLRVDRVLGHDLAGDARDQRGLAAVALLVLRLEPVPALGDVGRGRLGRVGDQAAMLLGQLVHARAGGEVVGRLGAAVQHDHQRQCLPVIGAGHVELVGAAAGLVAVRSGKKPGAVRQDSGVGVASPVSPPSPASRPLPLKRSRKLRSASGMADWAVTAIPPLGKLPMPVPTAFMAGGSAAVR